MIPAELAFESSRHLFHMRPETQLGFGQNRLPLNGPLGREVGRDRDDRGQYNAPRAQARSLSIVQEVPSARFYSINASPDAKASFSLGSDSRDHYSL